MFFPQCLLFRKGPLGTIWVAAHCHKRLKKHQVTQIDISTSVDKILLDEFPIVTYRIIGYLLLGVVRIYAKKVEYLFHDCHDILIKINDFAGIKKGSVHLEAMCTPYVSITLPESFELDAFDLEILEDVSGGNVIAHEEIMLKERDAWKNEVIGNHSFDKYHCEEAAARFGTSSTSYTLVRDPLHDMSNLEASLEKLRGDKSYLEERLDPMMLDEAEDDLEFVRSFGEAHHTAGEQIKFPDTDTFFSADKEYPDPELTRLFDQEKHMDLEQIKFPVMTNPVSEKHQITTEDHPVSITFDVTPESKFRDASGVTTPEFIAVRTPATKERTRISRKRKCFFDDIIVIPNRMLKQQIDNSSDLVCKRRKAPHTAFHAWKASQFSNLPQSFLEPLILGTSLELRSLFFNKKLKCPETVKTVESPEKIDLLGSQTVHRSPERTATAPSTPDVVVEPPGNLDLSGPPTVYRFPDQTDIAPSTPVTHSTSLRLHEVPEISNSDKVGPANSFESVLKGLSLSDDQELDISLLSEEINSCEGDYQETRGWSERTRIIAGYLHKNFLNGKKQSGKHAMNLLLVLKGKNKKESARLFYEILVLKTGGYVDVKQDNGYGNILVRETAKLKQACEADCIQAIWH
ncbi:sister chromatid cohesion 1 protein 2 isoform X2 [Cornus florida]|uniref:sister chromatid cohesion 1 protein 2 isoform X2 n=1 Tax=Cornus florida TaxID=4283 RepID=UPI00289D4B01|nr:sister chromatid cohesion 1 protein 2 isoform X2 [Cornus florida]